MSELTKALIQFHKDGASSKRTRKPNMDTLPTFAVLSTVTPALLKNDLVLTQEFLEDSLVTTLRHVSGETISSTSKLIVTAGRNELHSGASVTYTVVTRSVRCCRSLPTWTWTAPCLKSLLTAADQACIQEACTQEDRHQSRDSGI